MFTIDSDAKKNKVLPINLDFMGVRYRTESNKFVFPSPSFWLIEKNLFFLAANSTKKIFDQKYVMRPDYLSFDEYETVVLAPLLMYVNRVFNTEDFNLNEVIIPEISAIIEILVDKYPELPTDKLEVVNW
jgi:hypothetical protein